jgi:hypothetical protein
VLHWLDDGASKEGIVAALLKLPSAPDDIGARIDAIEKNLLEYNLIIPSKSDKEFKVEIDADTAMDIEDSMYGSDITVSSDVQKMLLNDPIHDVSIKGWEPTINPDAL